MSESSNSQASSESGNSRLIFCFRPDLKFVYENRDGQPGISVVDPVNGKQFSFNEQEHFLCQAADGRSNLAAIREKYRVRFDREISLRDMLAFYRRLRILGLLETGETASNWAAAELGQSPAFGVGGAFGQGGGGGAGLGGGGLGGAGGGFGGGAGRQGGPGIDRLIAALAAKQGNSEQFGPDGMYRQPTIAPVRKQPASLYLFNPNGLLRLLYVLFYPTRYFLLLLVPAVVMAGLVIIHRWDAFSFDFVRMTRDYATVTLMLLGALSINFISRMTQGVVIVGSGSTVRQFGISLVFGFIPRFFIDMTGVRALDRRGQLWTFAAPLLTRLALFALGTIVWITYRDTGTWFPELALLIGQFAFWVFLLTAFPLLPAEGLRWLATYYGEPRLGQKAATAIKYKLSGRPMPPMIRTEDVAPLVIYGLGTLLTATALILFIFVHYALVLEEQLGGLGVVIFLGLVAAFLLWLLAVMSVGPRRAAGIAFVSNPGVMPDAVFPREVIDSDQVDDPASISLLSKAQVIWCVLAAALVGVAFLPYTYEAGGIVEMLPNERSQAVARTDGEIVAIYVKEGDFVERGQLVAQLSSWEQEGDAAVTGSLLDKEKAELARLEAGAKPEEILLAESQVDSAEAEGKFSKMEADRAEELFKTGTNSRQDWERATTAYETNLAELDVARANLDLVKSGATQEEILAAEAEVERLTLQLDYQRDELARTRIYAPIGGQVVTPNLQLMHGDYIETGDTLLELDNDDYVRAAIAVPEADVGIMAIGDKVRLKAYGRSNEAVIGEVQSIAPTAEEREYGRVVRVDAVFANADGSLRSAMTGYAKVEGAQMRVWEAYLRRIIRFFEIEVWSWIP